MKGFQHILIVEDELSHQMLIRKALEADYRLTFCASEAEARMALERGHYDLFLLDINLPDGNGFQVLLSLRDMARFKTTPVMFLTSREDVESKLMGFSLGADDYVVKPCEARELKARVEARLRRAATDQVVKPLVQTVGPFSFNLSTHTVEYVHSGSRVYFSLTPLEFRLLLYMAQNPNAPLTREQILLNVWGQDTHVSDRSVDAYIASLRRKLKPYHKFIRAVHGVGYRLYVDEQYKAA